MKLILTIMMVAWFWIIAIEAILIDQDLIRNAKEHKSKGGKNNERH